MMKISFTIYHFIVLSWYIFLNYFISLQEEDTRKSFIFQDGGKWKYLTFLNLFLQAIFYGIACLEDVLKGIKGKKHITFVTALRDRLFTTLVFPISTFVFLTFWIIFLYDRELIYPKDLDNVFPVWLNHAMHTLILPLSFVEIFQRPHSYLSKKKGLSFLSVACLSYMGRWVQIPFRTIDSRMSPLESTAPHSRGDQQQFPQTANIHRTWDIRICMLFLNHNLAHLIVTGDEQLQKLVAEKAPTVPFLQGKLLNSLNCYNVITWLYSKTGTWVYPVFSKLSPLSIAAFFFLSYIFIIGIYVFGETLNFWKWGEVIQPKKKRK